MPPALHQIPALPLAEAEWIGTFGGLIFVIIWFLIFSIQLAGSKKRKAGQRNAPRSSVERPPSGHHKAQPRYPSTPPHSPQRNAPKPIRDFFEALEREALAFETPPPAAPPRRKRKSAQATKPAPQPPASPEPANPAAETLQIATPRSAKETHLHLPRIEALAVRLEKLPLIPMPQMEQQIIDHRPQITLTDRAQLRHAMRLHILLSPPKCLPLDSPPRP